MNYQRPVFRLLPILLLIFLVGCTSVTQDSKLPANSNRSVVSPSGKYLLKVVDQKISGTPHSKFEILSNNSNSKVVYTCPDTFRTTDILYFVWDDKDRVWVYSKDAGTFFWSMSQEGKWERHDYFASKEPAPDFLKKAQPSAHPY